MLSLFGRLNYSINDLAFITATLRQDHTSRFSPKNRVGLFPALGVAFKLIDNNNKYFNNLKARIGWGVTGQQDIGDYYLYQGLYQKSFNTARYQLGDGFITTYRPNGYDEGIKWETTTTYNLGLDISFIKDRLSGSVEIYQKDTEDLLNNSVQVPVGSNLTNIIATNIGNMKSKGIEFSVNTTPIINNNLIWDFNANISINKSEITKLNTEDDSSIGEETGGIAGGVGNTIQIHTVGYEPSAFYVYEQKYDESGKLLPGEFIDRNGDGDVNELDKYRIETSRPKLVFGMSNSLSYKKLTLSFAGRAHIGNQVYNNIQTNIGFLDRLDNLAVLNNIHQAGVDNNIKEQDQATYSDAYIQDASFFRIDHVTLNYDFGNLIGKNLRVYATIQNPLVITKYEGIDPEVFGGIDNNLYPRPKVYIVGLNVNF
jgi:iron complex outermembrane receptor protein